MEIAFFFEGITRTASDQSISLNSAQSGSFATEASTSSSVMASKRAQSVFPLRRSPHRRVMIRSFFILSRTARRNNPDQLASVSKNHRHDSIIRFSDRNPSLLVVTVGSPDDNWFVKNLAGAVEADAV